MPAKQPTLPAKSKAKDAAAKDPVLTAQFVTLEDGSQVRLCTK